MPEKPKEGNVWLAESGEVRPEFRQHFAPIDLLDYIYAVLHSPSYREKYKEFLKIDFPRVPYPKDTAVFWKLLSLGRELRQIHLLESPQVSQYITQYPVDGDNVVDKPRFEAKEKDLSVRLGGLTGLIVGKVYINPTQYFDQVPERPPGTSTSAATNPPRNGLKTERAGHWILKISFIIKRLLWL